LGCSGPSGVGRSTVSKMGGSSRRGGRAISAGVPRRGSAVWESVGTCPSSKTSHKTSQQALDAIVAKGKTQFRIILRGADIGPLRGRGEVDSDHPGERDG